MADDTFDELLPQTRRALTQSLATAQAEGRAPSLAGAVARDGFRLWRHAAGTSAAAPGDGGPRPDTQYRIGSITKTFTAVLVLRLREEGLLDLADPVAKHLPDASVLPAPVPELTLAQLLSHTSGLAAETPPPWWERTPGTLRPGLGDLFREPPAVHPAGRRHHYSNSGFALLGAVVARLRGVPWEEAVRDELLRPLGMDRTSAAPTGRRAAGFAVHPWADVLLPEAVERTGAMAPAGELWSTPEDLGRWAGFLLHGRDGVLGAEVLEEMRRPVSPVTDEEWDTAWGLGIESVRRSGRLLFGHGGSMPGFLAGLWIDAKEGVSAAVVANATSGPSVSGLAAELVAEVCTREPRMPEEWRPLPAAEADPALLALTGPWYWGASPFALQLRAGRQLELRPLGGAGRSSRFRPDGADRWTGLDDYYAGEPLRVVRGADGEPAALDLGSFVFTREPYGDAPAVPGSVDPGGWQGV